MTARWTLGTLIGLPTLIVVIAALVAVGVLLIRKGRRMHSGADPYGEWRMVFCGGVAVQVVAAIVLIAALVGFYPYSASYHQWRPVSGTVSEVSSRLLSGSGSGGINQRFVVQFAGSGRQYGCDDTRCSLIRVGDHITLSCLHEWQYAGTSGYGCNYVKDDER